MSELPTGTVTFLFTDVEGSTRLWDEHPDAMRQSLEQHDALLRGCIESAGGRVFKTIGDAFCAAFADPHRAIDAVLAAQESMPCLALKTPGGNLPLRVRMALHTGPAQQRDDDYFGPALNRVARLLAIGHGGQVLLSAATHELVQDDLPSGASLRGLGEHRLKDLGRPENVFQLCHPRLPEGFPALRSLDHAGVQHNLPLEVTSFIGRERELADVRELLGRTRLLTLTGVGGCGKTRLALHEAADLLDGYSDGVWLVELAPVSDPALVAQRVATLLGVKEEPDRALPQTLVECLKPKHLLIVLDNCEHLLAACAELANAVLRNCPHVRILATSREDLGIAGELTYRVPSLSLPDERRDITPELLSRYEAARLFIERAQFHQPQFAVTNQNARAVASVCHRLDGIPLAIELAAARVHAMPVEQIEQRLDRRFRLLTGGSRTALPRQQTLRATLDWSYDLLSEAERKLLRRLSVFAGGWTLDAAEGICAGEGVEEWDVLDLLSSLVAKSLVRYGEALAPGGGGEARYRLMETVRQYAGDRLLEAGEAEAIRGRHLGWFLALAEQAHTELFGPEQRVWLDRLEGEHDNLRAAVAWSAEQEGGEAGLRLGAALWRFWSIRGYLREGREHLHAVLSHPEASAATAERARALDGAGLLAMNCGDFNEASRLYEEALSIGRKLGDGRVIAMACNSLADARLFTGQGEAARPLNEEALRFAREVGDQWNVAYALTALGRAATWQRDFTSARSLLTEGLAIKRALGDRRSIAYSVHQLAALAVAEENRSEARSLYEESLGISRELGDTRWSAVALQALSELDRAEGDFTTARARLAESAGIYAQLGDKNHAAENLLTAAEIAAVQGQSRLAARILGARQALQEPRDAVLSPAEVVEREAFEGQEPSVASLGTVLGEEAFEAAWREGWGMTPEQAAADILDGDAAAGA